MADYNLNGSSNRPQVSPEASYWLRCPTLRIITIQEVRSKLDVSLPQYPSDSSVQAQTELQELQQLFLNGEDVNAFPQGQLSAFLRNIDFVRSPPIGSVIHKRQSPTPFIKYGSELARLFENETPGLWHRHVLNVLFDPQVPNGLGQRFSPPLQAFIWSALDVSIASALMAVWHYKWLATGLTQVARRPRPVEINPALSVLYDFEATHNAAGDITRGPLKNAGIISPGTPRHPAYGSGHSTYSKAASFVLAELLPTFRTDFDMLADNIGIARLWGGVHWRTDHEAGQRIGQAIGELIVEQIKNSRVLDTISTLINPPSRSNLENEAIQHQNTCGQQPSANTDLTNKNTGLQNAH